MSFIKFFKSRTELLEDCVKDKINKIKDPELIQCPNKPGIRLTIPRKYLRDVKYKPKGQLDNILMYYKDSMFFYLWVEPQNGWTGKPFSIVEVVYTSGKKLLTDEELETRELLYQQLKLYFEFGSDEDFNAYEAYKLWCNNTEQPKKNTFKFW